MALIKCSECGADISEKASICPKCGCPLDVTKEIIADAQKKKKKEIVTIVMACLVLSIIVIIAGFSIVKYNNTSSNIAIRLIKKDYGRDIEVKNIYYNSEVNGCIVKFSVNGEDDTATVHLEDKTVGYRSVMDEYNKKSKNSKTDEEKKQNAEKVVEYMNLYDMIWVGSMDLYGTEETGWEKIK